MTWWHVFTVLCFSAETEKLPIAEEVDKMIDGLKIKDKFRLQT